MLESEVCLDGVCDEVVELLALLSARGDGGPDALAPLPADLGLGALGDFTVDYHEADLLLGSVVRRVHALMIHKREVGADEPAAEAFGQPTDLGVAGLAPTGLDEIGTGTL